MSSDKWIINKEEDSKSKAKKLKLSSEDEFFPYSNKKTKSAFFNILSK